MTSKSSVRDRSLFTKRGEGHYFLSSTLGRTIFKKNSLRGGLRVFAITLKYSEFSWFGSLYPVDFNLSLHGSSIKSEIQAFIIRVHVLKIQKHNCSRKHLHTYVIDHSPLRLFRANETNNCNELNRLRIPTSRRQTSWLYTSAAEELNKGLSGTNPASGQSGTWTQDLQISSPGP